MEAYSVSRGVFTPLFGKVLLFEEAQKEVRHH